LKTFKTGLESKSFIDGSIGQGGDTGRGGNSKGMRSIFVFFGAEMISVISISSSELSFEGIANVVLLIGFPAATKPPLAHCNPDVDGEGSTFSVFLTTLIVFLAVLEVV
jgi:hypothetical protein